MRMRLYSVFLLIVNAQDVYETLPANQSLPFNLFGVIFEFVIPKTETQLVTMVINDSSNQVTVKWIVDSTASKIRNVNVRSTAY